MLPKILCIVGATSSGKTSLGIRIAKKYSGEIINADSRQIYKKISIGTGKPEGEWGMMNGAYAYIVQDVPHHLMDVIEPTESWTVTEWRDEALKKISSIIERGFVPIIVGGTGLYIRALIDNPQYPAVPPQLGFRSAMENKTLEEISNMLLRLDPDAEQMIDMKNPRRVLRALEVATYTGKPFTKQQYMGEPLVDAVQIGLEWTREELYSRIDSEIDSMIARGWQDEVRAVLKTGVQIDCPAMLSIGYRELARDGMSRLNIEKIKRDVRQYAKRQLTWFKHDKRITWVDGVRHQTGDKFF